MQLHGRLLEALVQETRNRKIHDDWVERERAVVAITANLFVQVYGGTTVTLTEVERCEQWAIGHSDYGTKLCLYVAEFAVHGEAARTRTP